MEATRRRLQQVVRQRTEELSDANRRLRRVARTDQLTGLPNRRYVFDRIRDDVPRSRRAYCGGASENRDIAFMTIDLDDFKRINDQYGHDAGDRVLLDFSRVLSEQLRETDYLIRWGGEEFLVAVYQAKARGRDRWVPLWPGERLDIEAHPEFVRNAKSLCEALIEEGVLSRAEGS